MGILSEPEIENFDVIAYSFEQISDRSEQPRDVGCAWPGGV